MLCINLTACEPTSLWENKKQRSGNKITSILLSAFHRGKKKKKTKTTVISSNLWISSNPWSPSSLPSRSYTKCHHCNQKGLAGGSARTQRPHTHAIRHTATGTPPRIAPDARAPDQGMHLLALENHHRCRAFLFSTEIVLKGKTFTPEL